MALAAGIVDESTPNDPRAVRMAFIASVTFNVVVGSIFGSPGVLLKPMSEHLGVSTVLIGFASLAVIVSSAVFAPMLGSIAVRRPMKQMLAVAAVMLSAAWLIIGYTSNYYVYLAAYALLLGPVMALGASIVPPTLVTRWFNRNRGLAIGMVHLPIVVAAMPLAAEWTISNFGLQAAFIALAALPICTLLPASFFIIDRPPGQQAQVDALIAHGGHQAMTIMQLLRQPRFWAICLSVGVANTSSTMLGLHLVTMAESWGVERMHAAGLASIMSGVGMAGSILMGILADRIGGARTLMVIGLSGAILWALFLAGLPYAGLAAVVGLIGVMGAGAVPAMSKALGDNFGRETFSKAIGLMVPVTLPLLALGMVGSSMVERATHSYTLVVIASVAAFAVAALLAFFASGKPKADT